jgi:hypothetical protein
MTIGTKLERYHTANSSITTLVEAGTQPTLTNTTGVCYFPQDTNIKNKYTLQANLFAEVKTENDKYIAFDYQINEYGIGDSPEEACEDLLGSLVDYFISLEKREKRLATTELQKLQILRNLLAKK